MRFRHKATPRNDGITTSTAMQAGEGAGGASPACREPCRPPAGCRRHRPAAGDEAGAGDGGAAGGCHGIPALNELNAAGDGGFFVWVLPSAWRIWRLILYCSALSGSMRGPRLPWGAHNYGRWGLCGGNLCLTTRCRFYNQSPLWRESGGRVSRRGAIAVTLCHARGAASPFSRLIPPLLSRPWGLRFMSPAWRESRRQKPWCRWDDLYGEDGRVYALPLGALVTGVSLPAPNPGYRTGYAKYRLRNSIDFPLAGVAAGLRVVGRRGDISTDHIGGSGAPHLIVAEERPPPRWKGVNECRDLRGGCLHRLALAHP